MIVALDRLCNVEVLGFVGLGFGNLGEGANPPLLPPQHRNLNK